ncbi:fatty acid-binding protein 10-A, liver basic-like isoform X2 [Branchiostoma floridae]|uniref:Fatty acid-binding protein 10-A, liver basic-like isoform X2 n=1 Tax=Branchiostoma floridae TaxID=7739 RepID=A0A9J7NCS9_BRAFL|nr:fatty acid-binding protein 10-A, liver basic-like isoform X2 [Branchiostoma floridae]
MPITDFNGTWKAKSTDNLDAYLTAAGVPAEYWDTIKSGTVTHEFSQTGDSVTWKNSGNDGRSVTNTFKFGQTFGETGMDGKTHQAVVTFAGGKLTYNYPDFNGKGTAGSMVKEVSGGKLTETVSLGSVTAKVFYTK